MHSQQEPSSPFQHLTALEKAVTSHTQKEPSGEISRSEWVGVTFLSGNHVILAPLNEVVEIMRVRLLFHVPGVKPWLRGMAASHGEIFPITDLWAFLTKKLSAVSHHSRILVVNNDDECLGFLVDKVIGLIRIPSENRKKWPTNVIPEFEPFLSGAIVNEDIEFPVMSLTSLCRHPRFRDVALRKESVDGGKRWPI